MPQSVEEVEGNELRLDEALIENKNIIIDAHVLSSSERNIATTSRVNIQKLLMSYSN